MTCPICDQKPMNCDCSPRERAMYLELQELEDMPTTFTLTDAEREAVAAAVRIIDAYEEEMDGFPSGAAATLRGLLERTKSQQN